MKITQKTCYSGKKKTCYSGKKGEVCDDRFQIIWSKCEWKMNISKVIHTCIDELKVKYLYYIGD